MTQPDIILDIPDFFRIISFKILRRTKGVNFDEVPVLAFPHIDAIDRVIHEGGALSPGSIGGVERPWYMHPAQADNLVVLHGKRFVELFTRKHNQIERFTVTPNRIEHNGQIILDGPGMLCWPCRVFHRIRSCETLGSASINLAVHFPGFDLRTNFNIYDMDTGLRRATCLRQGFLDQPTAGE